MADKHTNLIVSQAPHVASPVDTRRIMADVLIALAPACIYAIYMFGISAFGLLAVCVVSCVVFEWLTRKILKRPQTVGDLSAVVTGVLLALNLPSSLPYWMAVIGCFIAIVCVKQLFGGLGQNFANPAITARIALFVGFSSYMTSWPVNSHMDSAILQAAADAASSPTPLVMIAKNMQLPSYISMFLGKINGSMGEISTLLLLLGGIYLVCRKVISPIIPVCFIGTAAVLSMLFGYDPIYQVCAGGLVLGAIFMATDYVTSPITPAGKVIFGIGCGVLTMLIRIFGSYPEGVSFSILIMNILTPQINQWTRKKPRKGTVLKEGANGK